MRLLDNTLDFRELEDESVVTIGVFDGVHVGHREIMSECVREAKRRGSPSVVLTFDRNPRQLIEGSSPCIITPNSHKVDIVRSLGVDYMIVIEFDEQLAIMDPASFCRKIVKGDLKARQVCVGENFRFGKGGSGDTGTLERMGRELGYEVDVIPLVSIERGTLSSTLIRALINEGEVREVAGCLGRPHEIKGKVIKGHSRGKAMGFPTANLSLERDFCVPRDGVYAGKAMVDGKVYACAVNIGFNPTFHNGDHALEVFLLDFEGEIYGETVEVQFFQRLRDEMAFKDEESLINQMRDDVERTRDILG